MTDYPKTMVHPDHAAAIVGPKVVDSRGRATYGQGVPERYPNVSVYTADQEEQYRAKGYVPFGEARPVGKAGSSEWPKMLLHPEHEDAIPDELHARLNEQGGIERWTTPGRPEKFPHVFVNSPAEEASWVAKGYEAPGKFDLAAVEASKAAPYRPEFEAKPYPRWEGDVLVTDPAGPTGGIQQYPKYIASHDVTVASAQDEAKLLGRPWPPPPVLPPPESEADRVLRVAKEQAAAIVAAAQASVTPKAARKPRFPGRGKKAWETRQRRLAEQAAQSGV